MTIWRFGPVARGVRRLPRFLCGTAIALALGVGSQPVLAQTFQSEAAEQPPLVRTQPRDFDIPAQPLTSALIVFGDQGDLQVTADTAVLTGLTSQPVSGRMAPEEALARLLSGSGLRYRFTSADTVTLERMVAEPAAELEGGPAQLGAITVEGQLAADPSDLPFMTPGSSAYISLEQIERIPPNSPGDIFKEVPGVLSGASNDGTSINVNIRSSQGLNRVRTMVEGTQQENSFYQGYAGSDQRTYIDPDLIGGVEISKGPGSGPYGAGTTSGVVNLRLLSADDLVPEGESFGLRLRGGLSGSAKTPQLLDNRIRDRNADTGLRERDRNDFLADDNWFGSIAGAYRSDRFELVGAYAKRKEGNYFAGRNGPETFHVLTDRGDGPESDQNRFTDVEPGQEVPNTSEDTRSFLFRGTLRFDDGHALEAGFNRYQSDFGQAFPSSLNRLPPQQFALREVESNRYWLRYQWDSRNDLIDLQANLWLTNAEEALQENDAWGAEIWNNSFFDTGLGGLTLSYGGEYARSEAVDNRQVFLFGTEWGRGPGGDVGIFESFSPGFDGSREVFGGYLNALFEPTDWLSLSAGLRYDRFKGESTSTGFVCDADFDAVERARATFRPAVDEAQRRLTELIDRSRAQLDAGEITQAEFNALLSGPEAQALLDARQAAQDALNAAQLAAFNNLDGYCGTGVVESELDGSRFSPNVGVTVEPLDGLQLFATYAEGFRAPSLVELGQTVGGPVTVNPDLEPEVVRTTEVGVNYLGDNIFLEDDILRAKLVYFRNDYDNFVARTGGEATPGGGSSFFYENVPDVTVSGYEVSLFYDTGWAFADVNVSLFDEDFDTPTQVSIQQPEYTGTVTLGTRWLDESLVLGSRLTFFGELPMDDVLQATVFSEARFYWTDQRIFDLFGSYQVNDYLSLGFSVENVTDRFYMPPLYVSRIPAPGRTFRVHFTAASF